MKYNLYKDLVVNKILHDSPDYMIQDLINLIREEGIGTYSKKEEHKIYIHSIPKDEKIVKCIEGNLDTLKLFDNIEFNKGYKYSMLFKYTEIDFSMLKEFAINYDDLDYRDFIDSEVDIDRPIYMERESLILIKFHKSISITNMNELRRYDIRYPILLVFHKNISLLEMRFDRLSNSGNDDFYKISINARLTWVKERLKAIVSSYELDTVVKYIVDNKKEEVAELIWSFALAKEKGATLKSGTDKTMPFIGELEDLIKENNEVFMKSEDTKQCLNIINKYLNNVKRFSNARYRILRWIKPCINGENEDDIKPIDLRIVFNYRDNHRDLINFYESEINDMERMNYVIKYIREVEQCIKKLQSKPIK